MVTVTRLSNDVDKFSGELRTAKERRARLGTALPSARWIRANVLQVTGTSEERIAELRARGALPPSLQARYVVLLRGIRDRRYRLESLTGSNLGRWVTSGDIISTVADSQASGIRAVEVLALVFCDILDGRGLATGFDLSGFVGEVDGWPAHVAALTELDGEIARLDVRHQRAVAMLRERLAEGLAATQVQA